MTNTRLMKLQPNLQLRKIGNKYMIVSTASGNVNMTDVFTLNAVSYTHLGIFADFVFQFKKI